MDARIYFYVFQLLLVASVFGIIFNFAQDNVQGTTLEKRFLSRDIALMIDTIYLNNHPTSITYELNKELYTLTTEQEKGTTYIVVQEKEGGIQNRYPVIVTSDTAFTKDILGAVGLNTLTITKDERNFNLEEQHPFSNELPEMAALVINEYVYPVDTKERVVTSCVGPRGINPEGEANFIDCKEQHCGIDLRARNSEHALAVTDGEVIGALFGPGNYGTIKIKDKFGTEIWYLHLEKSFVKEHDPVSKGQAIGITGSTVPHGDPPLKPHLHLEIHYQGKKIDPLATGAFDLAQVKFARDSNCYKNKEAYAYAATIEQQVIE